MIKIDLEEKKVKSFLENIFQKYSQRTFNKLQMEQIAYRMYLCEKCIIENACQGGCGCDPTIRLSEPISCDESKFPDFFKSENEWNIFKQKNNIEII